MQFAVRIGFISIFLAFAILGLAQAPEQSRSKPVLRSTAPTRGQEAQKQTDQAGSANLVTVPALVMDRNGRYIANLKSEDFKIYEDGAEQTISYFASVEKPFTVALMLDVSGSTQLQLTQIREAANTFVSRLRSNDRLMALTFDGQINLLTEPADVATIRRSRLHIPPVTDGTVLYDAVDFTLKRMAQIPGRKAVVLMTDGVDQSSRASLKSTLDDLAEQDVLFYTVQYNTLPQLPERLNQIKNEKARRKVRERLMKGYAVSEPYLRALAEKTGGRYYRAEDLGDVGPAFEAITEELGVEYTLGYYPKENSGGSAERGIKVRVRYPNMVVRTRDSHAASVVAKQ